MNVYMKHRIVSQCTKINFQYLWYKVQKSVQMFLKEIDIKISKSLAFQKQHLFRVTKLFANLT